MGTDLVGKRLGEFEITRELGRGGMGVVYDAVQTSLGRRVALKVLGPGLGLTPTAVDRFRREAAAAAKLHHTNIVPVYATGEEDGVHFYAMELIDGPSLDAVIRQLRDGQTTDTCTDLPAGLAATGAYVPADPAPPPSGSGVGTRSSANRFDRAAAMIADVADALHHAHQQGVTHRDIKPSNLLLSSDGRLSVTDFGLARMLEQPGMTVTGEFVGTPAYMSPEQITAGRIPVDHRTDIYSLGATLYELLTLRPPFSADGRDRLLAMVVQKDPAPPRSVDPRVPKDLETICLKCLEKDPDRRYQTAKDLADDLQRFVSRFAILAKRTGVVGRARKWVKRNPWVAGLVAAVIVACGAAGLFAWEAHRAEQRRVADEQRRDEEARAEKRRAALEKAQLLALGGEPGPAREALFEAERLGAERWEVRLYDGFIRYQEGDYPEAERQLRQSLELHPDGVAARALLAMALYGQVEWIESARLRSDVLSQRAVTFEDRLFVALALSVWEADDALRRLDGLARERPSRVIDVLRAEAYSYRVLQTHDVRGAAELVEAAEAARVVLNRSRRATALAFRAHLRASVAYARAGNAAQQKAHLDRAAAYRDELNGRWPRSVEAVRASDVFPWATDPRDRRADLTDRWRAVTPETLLSRVKLVDNLYRAGRYDEARAEADRWPADRLIGLYRVLLALDGRYPGRAAIDVWREWAGPREGWDIEKLRVGLPYLMLCGPAGQGEAKAVVQWARNSGARADGFSPGDFTALLDYLGGAIDDDRYLAAVPTLSPFEASRRLLLIGCARLGRGEQAEGQKALEDVVDLRLFGGSPDLMAAAILSRRARDPGWPRAVSPDR